MLNKGLNPTKLIETLPQGGDSSCNPQSLSRVCLLLGWRGLISMCTSWLEEALNCNIKIIVPSIDSINNASLLIVLN